MLLHHWEQTHQRGEGTMATIKQVGGHAPNACYKSAHEQTGSIVHSLQVLWPVERHLPV